MLANTNSCNASVALMLSETPASNHHARAEQPKAPSLHLPRSASCIHSQSAHQAPGSAARTRATWIVDGSLVFLLPSATSASIPTGSRDANASLMVKLCHNVVSNVLGAEQEQMFCISIWAR
ncbi:hypothetical protein VZT92_020206 [Zoarces viviparus]|uniref:Uncharacterized protein n=1 Tax=Zoarces viviparus TaxID=48416 RepID=A0AAW1ECY0_ZOAVI